MWNEFLQQLHWSGKLIGVFDKQTGKNNKTIYVTGWNDHLSQISHKVKKYS